MKRFELMVDSKLRNRAAQLRRPRHKSFQAVAEIRVNSRQKIYNAIGRTRWTTFTSLLRSSVFLLQSGLRPLAIVLAICTRYLQIEYRPVKRFALLQCQICTLPRGWLTLLKNSTTGLRLRVRVSIRFYECHTFTIKIEFTK
jgi:hypothetical protein